MFCLRYLDHTHHLAPVRGSLWTTEITGACAYSLRGVYTGTVCLFEVGEVKERFALLLLCYSRTRIYGGDVKDDVYFLGGGDRVSSRKVSLSNHIE